MTIRMFLNDDEVRNERVIEWIRRHGNTTRRVLSIIFEAEDAGGTKGNSGTSADDDLNETTAVTLKVKSSDAGDSGSGKCLCVTENDKLKMVEFTVNGDNLVSFTEDVKNAMSAVLDFTPSGDVIIYNAATPVLTVSSGNTVSNGNKIYIPSGYKVVPLLVNGDVTERANLLHFVDVGFDINGITEYWLPTTLWFPFPISQGRSGIITDDAFHCSSLQLVDNALNIDSSEYRGRMYLGLEY